MERNIPQFNPNAEYLRTFKNTTEFQAAWDSEYIEPWVSYNEETEEVKYNMEPMRKQMLTFDILSDGDIMLCAGKSSNTVTLSYKKNDNDWVSITSAVGENAPHISVSEGDTVMFKGKNQRISTNSATTINYFSSTCFFNASGNIASLLYEDAFENVEKVTGDSSNAFSCLFYGCTGLTDASKLCLPFTELGSACYFSMFSGCTNLITAPELPATNISQNCYNTMFKYCENLVKVPKILPATELKANCYTSMFSHCYKLKKVPKLPASTMASSCYKYMFSTCTSLETPPELPATNLSNYSYQYMFVDCTNLKTAPELSATTLAQYCYECMFSGCTALATATLELPATTLAVGCYKDMFRGCTALKSGPSVLPATTLEVSCYQGMFNGCASLETAPEISATTMANSSCTEMFRDCTDLTDAPTYLLSQTLSPYCYQYMFRNCQSLTYAPVICATTMANYSCDRMFYYCINLDTVQETLPATTLANHCYDAMFGWCMSLETAPELPATTLGSHCYELMFHVCTSLTTAPELPATTLADYCYAGMFSACTSINTTPELPATTLAPYCYQNMFKTCTALTETPELRATTLTRACYEYMFQDCGSITGASIYAVSLDKNSFRQMFQGCKNLKTMKCLATDVSAQNATQYWLNMGSSTGTFIKNPSMESWSRNAHGIPSGWNVIDDDGINVLEAPYVLMNNYEEKTLTICPDSEWEITSYPNWLTISSLSGVSGFNTIGVTAQTNNTGAERAGNITIRTTDSSYTKTIEVRQFSAPENIPLTFFIKSNGYLYWMADDTAYTLTIEYNKNNEGWTSITSNKGNSAPSISLIPGDVVQFRGDNVSYTNANNKVNKISGTTECDLYGNIMSMIDSTGFSQVKEFGQNTERNFRNFFDGLPVIDASNLVLPATSLTPYCYQTMFRNTKKMLYPPELPATVLADHCYSHMFYGSSLMTAPELPATTITEYCYEGMFRDCSALTTPPTILPAMTLAKNCYGYTSTLVNAGGMFQGCTSLTYGPELPATTLADYCYEAMFSGCTNLIYPPELPATTLANNCYQYMFQDCTSLTTAPELPATTLARYCYRNMFERCTGLTTAPELPATTLQEYCYTTMFKNCINITTVPNVLPATTLTTDCYNSIFMGCALLTKAPELPALHLATKCYKNMFNGCSNLKYVKAMFVDTPTTGDQKPTSFWLDGVNATGTFVRNNDAEWTLSGQNGIPVNWMIDYANE